MGENGGMLWFQQTKDSDLAPRDREGEREPERTEIIGLCGQ